MILNNKNIYKNLIEVVILLLIILASIWFFWPAIKELLFGSEYQPVSSPYSAITVDQELKKDVMSKLEKLIQYGQWPLSINEQNLYRGDPFIPKKQ
ncbi:MAG: hypothetical protein COU81_00545 [Candidatus Portnoybacteria bacterium CG10_big_fil_rev_8_21_14_0_10_36_7]|uniref:Uncharacterized protein n=1 Tax=Candidatus Portnoybacteria bacterium CG10_big_fil_rev_8_21_14_0_10_36_7 TaxID=1974812 RepID=A0A2M8KEY3_9BACT|nr:MAG: hypothetical protein COU81_00545 [Candidatus Portnoybacteria bacterium CG10_big_fil_rev_8_21_14_0_10_36_7]